MKTLQNQRIIITGGSRGIGRAIAVQCANEGATVGLNYFRSHDAAQALRRQYEPQLRLLSFDVSDEIAAENAIEQFLTEEGQVDCLVNCAGVLAPNLLIKSSVAEIRRQIAVNLLGTIICSQSVLRSMLQRRQGVILNISSVASERPMAGQAAYSASKAGVEGFTRALALEYGRKNIRALALRLGPVNTDLLRPVLKLDDVQSRLFRERLAEPEEVAKFAVNLLTDSCSLATGSILTFDGGYSIS